MMISRAKSFGLADRKEGQWKNIGTEEQRYWGEWGQSHGDLWKQRGRYGVTPRSKQEISQKADDDP